MAPEKTRREAGSDLGLDRPDPLWRQNIKGGKSGCTDSLEGQITSIINIIYEALKLLTETRSAVQ